MASFSQRSGRLTALFPQPALSHINNPDKSPSDFPISNGNTPSGIFISNDDFSAAESELNYLQSNKVMPMPMPTPMDASKNREILMSSMAASIDGVLDITLHHARDIHNICIYGNQDVYAKFSITHTQDTVYSSQPARGGGKNPVFNQSLQILISKLDAVLKCEIWMMSCARTYLEDQLLGFVLVPLADLIGRGKLTQDYALSSTDLFHTPAGSVCLSLMFYLRGAEAPVAMLERSSSEVLPMENGNHGMMENGNHGMMMNDNHSMAFMDYNSIEFPDLQMASENQQLVSVYLKMASGDLNMDGGSCNQEDSRQQDCLRTGAHEQELSRASFLQLGSSPMVEIDCEMAMNNGDEKSDACNGSPELPSDDNGLSVDVEVPSPSTISISKTAKATTTEEVSVLETEPSRSVDVPTPVTTHFFGSSNSSQATLSPRSVSSGGGLSSSDDKTNGSSDGQESLSSFTTPLVSISLEPEEPVVQQQIVDMYMKSMQQFTESLAKMKLPLDLDGGQSHVELKNEPRADKKGASSESVTKDGHRVFYGSRAFF